MEGSTWAFLHLKYFIAIHKYNVYVYFQNTQYSIWKLSDLDDCDKLVTLFLFGNVHKDLWKHTVGSVIGLLNPTHLKNSEKVSYIIITDCLVRVHRN